MVKKVKSYNQKRSIIVNTVSNGKESQLKEHKGIWSYPWFKFVIVPLVLGLFILFLGQINSKEDISIQSNNQTGGINANIVTIDNSVNVAGDLNIDTNRPRIQISRGVFYFVNREDFQNDIPDYLTEKRFPMISFDYYVDSDLPDKEYYIDKIHAILYQDDKTLAIINLLPNGFAHKGSFESTNNTYFVDPTIPINNPKLELVMYIGGASIKSEIINLQIKS